MIKVVNKWNTATYVVVKDHGDSVILQRVDGSNFEISKREFKLNYVDFKSK